MKTFSRTSNNVFSRWWWSIDRIMLFAFLFLMAFGVVLAFAATPMVANRIGIEKFYFLNRHIVYIVLSLGVIFITSSLNIARLKKASLILFILSIVCIVLTLFFGVEIKGARRWISIFGFSIQPSEFTKPALVIIVAWMLAEEQKKPEFRGQFIAFVFILIFSLLLIFQPDIGMLFVTLVIWGVQLFLNGLPLNFIVLSCVAAIVGFIFAYMFLPHFTTRVDRFLDPAIGDQYQINRSLEAFSSGGLFGVGPGEGIIKKHIPDAHADFVFAVLGEEFGFFVCAFVVLVIAFIVVYGILKTFKQNNLFKVLSSIGLISQFGLQSIINIASALHMMPTKGMTLPFMSYGGSSMIAISISAGFILSLGKRKMIANEE